MYYYQHSPTCFGSYFAIFRTLSPAQNYCYYCWYIKDIIAIQKNTWNGKLHAKFFLFGLHIILNVIAVLLNVSVFQDAGGRLGFCFGDRSSQ